MTPPIAVARAAGRTSCKDRPVHSIMKPAGSLAARRSISAMVAPLETPSPLIAGGFSVVKAWATFGMAPRLQDIAEDMAAWIAVVAHERRSPLTIRRDLAKRAFEPFTRGDGSRSRRAGGSGLGLSLPRRHDERARTDTDAGPSGDGRHRRPQLVRKRT